MPRIIKQTEPRARKDYSCNLAESAGEIDWPTGMTFSEIRSLVIYQNKGRKILKGEIYICQFNEWEGQVYQFKMDKSIFEIFCKYRLFPDI